MVGGWSSIVGPHARPPDIPLPTKDGHTRQSEMTKRDVTALTELDDALAGAKRLHGASEAEETALLMADALCAKHGESEVEKSFLDSIFATVDVDLANHTDDNRRMELDVSSILEPLSGKRSPFQAPLPDLPRPMISLDTCKPKIEQGRGTSPKAVSSKDRKREWLQDNVIGVVETKQISPLARVQMRALQDGRDSNLKFVYDQNDELEGATCDGVFFSMEELRKMSVF